MSKMLKISIICCFVFMLIMMCGACTSSDQVLNSGDSTSKNVKPEEMKNDKEVSATVGRHMENLGFSVQEAAIIENIFKTIGIEEISNVESAIGTGIDELQSFVCDIYDQGQYKNGLTLLFTVENRQLCYVSLQGVPNEKIDKVYVSLLGNLKIKTVDSTKEIVLYDVWDDEGNIIEGAIGYKAVLDYSNRIVTAYEAE